MSSSSSSDASRSAGSVPRTPLTRVKDEPVDEPPRTRSSRGIVIREPGEVRLLTPKKEPGTAGSSLGRVLKKAFKKKAVKVEEDYDEDEALKKAMANSLNDVLPAKLEYAGLVSPRPRAGGGGAPTPR